MESDFEVDPNSDAADQETDLVKRPGWRSLFNFTTRIHLFPLSLAFIFSVASGIIIPVLAVLLGKLFGLFTDFGADKISGSELVKKVSVYGIALVGLGSASGLLNAGYFMIWLIFGELQAKSVRDRLFDGMLEKDMEWYDMRKNGVDTVISRLQAQVRELQMATSQPLGFAIQYTVTTLAALGVAFYTAWVLTFVTLATVPISAFILAWMSARMQPRINSQSESLTQASKLANNAISAIDTVKCFNGQDHEVWQYSQAINKAARSYLKQAQANALQIGFVRLVTLGMFVQGFWYGSHLVAVGSKTPGQVLTTFWACLMATQAIEQILPQMIVLEKGRAAGATLKAILVQMQRGRRVNRMNGGLTPGYCDGDIEVRNVSFAYPSRPEQLVLNKASFFFPAGETTFVIGRSGSGKSTLGNLLMRFYAPESGDLLIDGNSIKTLDINWLRNNVTLVQQQSVLFNETVFKNIAFGRRDHNKVRKEEVKRSIETAYLQNTITELPLGLDTVVGTGGSAMSGGQRQRVAIARARLRDTPILILDEATSALDYISRTAVMDAIREWRRGKTTIIVTHDMSQIQDNEYAYVLDNGLLVQEGFRQAMEKDETGPFERAEPGPFERATSSTNYLPATPNEVQIRQSASPDDEPSPRNSLASMDPMDIHFHPRSNFIPSVFGPSPDDLRSRRPSQGLISPLPPAAFSYSRMSITPSTFNPTRRRTMPEMGLFKPLPSIQLGPVEEGDPEPNDPKFSMGPSRDLDSSLCQSRRRDSRISMTALKHKNLMHTRRRKLTKDEKARRIAPARKILMTVWPTLQWRMRITLICGFLFAAIHAGGTPAFSWVFSKLLATFFLPSNRSQMALKWSLSVLGVAIVDAIASYSMHYLLESCGQSWIDSLRIQAMRRILDQPRAWFDRDKNSLTKLTECLDRNAEEMRNLLGRFAGFGFVAITMMLMAIVWSLILCWKLTLVGLASGPFLYAVTRSFEAVSGKWESKSNDAGEAASVIFTETFVNIRIVRALTLEGYFHKKYTKATNRAMSVGFKRSGYSGFFFGLADSGIIFVTALIFYYGAVLVSSGHYSIQDILTVFTMLLFSIANANAIIAFIPQMNSSRDTATRLLRLSNLPYKSSHEHSGHVRLSKPGLIAFESVSFTYPSRPEALILSNLNLTLNSNTSTALVGASGLGKSTITSLLLGLYPPTTGTLTFSSFSISDLHFPTLRNLISVVPQSPALFPTTIAKNITYALPETSPMASMDSIYAASTAAGIHDFISSLPHGYQTIIGKGGTGLSGGQAQRIVIARAVVRKPQLLILDEATSGLDGASAKVVRDMLSRLEQEGVGVIVVAHDREMMKGCREVVVLGEGGKVVERGGFDQLLSHRNGELRRLVGRK